MPAKSKAQQRFMGMVHAVQKGELSPSKVSDKVKDVADNMSDSDAEDFASTKHKGKPEKVAKEVIQKVRETIKPIVEDWWAKASDKTKAKYVQKHGAPPNSASDMEKDMSKAADDANAKMDRDEKKAKFEKQAKGDFESAIENGEGQWADEIVKMNSDHLPKGVQKDAQEALYAIQDAEMGMGGDADWAKDYLKKNVLPHIKVGEQSPEDAPTKLSTHEKEFIGDAEAVMKMDDPDAFDIRNAIEPFDDQGMDVSDLEDMADKLDKDKDSVDPDSVAKALGDIVSSYKKFGHSGPRENITKESIIKENSYAAMFQEMSKDMRSSYEVQALKDLCDEYDIGRVLYVFRTNPRAFKQAIKEKMKEMKTFNKAKKLKEGKRATKGFQKAFKTRKSFLEAMSDFRKKLGDMGTDPKIFKLEGELYKFEVEFQKKSAKLFDFMNKLSKSPITEAVDYENVFADIGDKLHSFQTKVVKPGMRVYNKGKAKSYMRDLSKSLVKCVELCDKLNLAVNESVVEQWRPYKPLLEKIIKIKKDPHKGVKNTAKGKKFNPLLLKGEDKIKALVWSGSHPTGKGSYELKGNKLNVMGLNPRDKGFYVSHFTKNTGIRRGNLYYDGVHWQGKKNF